MENKNPTWSVNKTENKTQIWRRSKIPLVAVFIAGILLGAVVVYSQIPVQSLTISRGIYPAAPTYTIWKESSTYYAKDASGLIAYSSTNASAVINACYSQAGVTVFLKSGEYWLIASILMQYNNTWLLGENKEATILRTSSNIDIIKITPASLGHMENAKVANVLLRGMGAGCTSMGINATGRVYYSTFEHITAEYCYNGLHFQSVYATRGYRHYFAFLHLKMNINAGLYMTQQDACTFYKVDSHSNAYGVILEDLCQGIMFDNVHADQNSGNGFYLLGVQGVHFKDCSASEATYGLLIVGGCTEIYLTTTYFEAATEAQISITNSYAFNNYDIKFTDCRIVRGEKQGIVIAGDNSKYTSNVLIQGCTIINNGQSADNTYAGIDCYGSGAEATIYVHIVNCYVGNDADETGDSYQRGISSINDCDYFLVMGCDVSTARYTSAATEQIALAGSNNIQEHNFGDA